MKEFNDPPTDDPNYWPSIRLADVREVARRLQRSGMWDVRLLPDWLLGLTFIDPMTGARVRLEIDPWQDGRPGWHWYAVVDFKPGFSAGPMGPGRTILNSPWPRQVVRTYLRDTWFERFPPHWKKR
jgi:hypothetical protein